MPDGLRRALVALAARTRATLFMTLAAGFSALLQALHRRWRSAAGHAERQPQPRRARGAGRLLVNTLVLRVDAANDPSFAELLGRVKASCVGAFSHEEVPFDRLVERQPARARRTAAAGPDRAGAAPPLPASVTVGALRMEPIAVPRTSAKVDQEWHFWRAKPASTGCWSTMAICFDAEALTRMFEHLETLLASACSDPRRRLSELELLTSAERHHLVVEWNDTGRRTRSTGR